MPLPSNAARCTTRSAPVRVVGLALALVALAQAGAPPKPGLLQAPRSWWRFMRNAPCPYVTDMAESVHDALDDAIRAQVHAVDNITRAVGEWTEE